MSRAASTYLPFGATAIVTLGAVMAVATSLNATMLVPARLAWHLAREGHVPGVFARLHATARTPVVGLSVSFGIVAALLVSGRMGLALGIAIVALMMLYALHSVALILLPSLSRALPEVTSRIARAAAHGRLDVGPRDGLILAIQRGEPRSSGRRSATGWKLDLTSLLSPGWPWGSCCSSGETGRHTCDRATMIRT
jgi:hypothetical protein